MGRVSSALSFADTGDVDHFVETLARFERGEIDADAWRAFRLLNGTYGQRQLGEDSMLRAKLPQGIVSAEQLEVLADVADRYSRGFCHVTTRQNVQFHFVALSEMGHAMRELALAGMTTREACGNSVRNVTTSPSAGVAQDELFDPTPYARALTRWFLRRPIATTLPRKFKIAFAGGGADHSFALVNDLAFVARLEGGRRGFSVTVGGGTALMCQSGRALVDFLPAGEILAVAEAVARIYHARGDREHRKKNRIKFLIKQLGWDSFHALFDEELARVRAEGVPPLGFDPDAPPDDEEAPVTRPPEPTFEALDVLLERDRPRGPGIVPRFLPVVGDVRGERFFRTNVRPQRQEGFDFVTVVIPLGDLSSGRLRALAALARGFACGTVRFTASQNVVLRWVARERVPALHARLVHIGLAEPDPESIADVASCPGAESCKLAVTQSRGLAASLGEAFSAQRELVDRAAGLTVRVSGCPNGCGLHHVAGLGFQGGLRKLGGRAIPQYHVLAGGSASGADGRSARFGRLIGKVPARRIPLVVERLVALYESARAPGESIEAFLGRAPVPDLKRAIADLEQLDEATAKEEDFVDLGDTTAFAPETTEGECAA